MRSRSRRVALAGWRREPARPFWGHRTAARAPGRLSPTARIRTGGCRFCLARHRFKSVVRKTQHPRTLAGLVGAAVFTVSTGFTAKAENGVFDTLRAATGAALPSDVVAEPSQSGLLIAILALLIALALTIAHTGRLRAERRCHEEQIRDLEALLQRETEAREKILDGLPVVAFAVDYRDGSTLYLSRNATHLLGMTPREARSQRDWWTAGIHPDDLERHADQWVSPEHPRRRRRYRFRSGERKNLGAGRWLVLEEAAYLENDGKRPIVYGTLTDVTADQNRIATIETEHQRLAAVVESSRLGTWELHIPSGEQRVNATWLTMLGESPETTAVTHLDQFLERIHPDDRETFEQRWQRYLATPAEHFEAEIRLRTHDGGLRWIQTTGRVITFDERGRPEWAFGVHRDVDAEVRNRDRLNRLATRDDLTGAPNRRQFLDDLRREIEAVRRWRHDSLVVIFDVDHFKRVNDNFGHAAGDAVLVEVVRRIEGVLRPRDRLGRLGGEEFGLILAEVELPRGPAAILERLRASLSDDPVGFEHLQITVTASFGASILRPDDDADRVLARADEALYAAKHGGRNRFMFAAIDQPWVDSNARSTHEDAEDPPSPQNRVH